MAQTEQEVHESIGKNHQPTNNITRTSSFNRWVTFLMAWSKKFDTKIIMFLLTCIIFILLVVYNKDEQLNVTIGRIASLVLDHYIGGGGGKGTIHFQEDGSAVFPLGGALNCTSTFSPQQLFDAKSVQIPCTSNDNCVTCCFNNITNSVAFAKSAVLMRIYNQFCKVNTSCLACFEANFVNI